MEDGIKKCLQEIRSKINIKTLLLDDVEPKNDNNNNNNDNNNFDEFLPPLMKTINLQQNPTNNNILQNSLDTNNNIQMPTEKSNEIFNENIGINNFHYMNVKNKKYYAPSNFVPSEQKTNFSLADEQPPLIINDAEIINTNEH
jgi:hypothetical protein